NVSVPGCVVSGNTRVDVGLRPEKIRLSEGAADAGSANHLRGVIRDASYIGVSTQYIVEARGGSRLTVYEQNVERATRAELWAPGEDGVLCWSPDHSFVVQGCERPPDEE